MATIYTGSNTLMVVSALVLLLVLYVFTLTVYRLLWHPLARFPGPKLAGATGWYETYYDCILLGKFSNHIDRMHKEYGKSVPIGHRIAFLYNCHRADCSNQPLGTPHQRP